MDDLKQWLEIANGIGVVGLLFINLYLIITGRLVSQATIQQMNEAHDARAQIAADRLADTIADRIGEATQYAISSSIGAALDKAEAMRNKEQETWRAELQEMEQTSHKRDEEWRQTIHRLMERIDAMASQQTESLREMGVQISANTGTIKRHSDTLGAIVQYIDETRRNAGGK